MNFGLHKHPTFKVSIRIFGIQSLQSVFYLTRLPAVRTSRIGVGIDVGVVRELHHTYEQSQTKTTNNNPQPSSSPGSQRDGVRLASAHQARAVQRDQGVQHDQQGHPDWRRRRAASEQQRRASPAVPHQGQQHRREASFRQHRVGRVRVQADLIGRAQVDAEGLAGDSTLGRAQGRRHLGRPAPQS